MSFREVAKVELILPGRGAVVNAGDKVLAVFNLNGTFYTLDNTRTHVGGPLGQGKVQGQIVTCPWHGSRFDITTGQVVGPPARRAVSTYPVRVEGGKILVDLS